MQIYYNGTWGTVCNHHWDIDDARVVCRQIGPFYAVAAYRNARYGEGTGPILLDHVHCLGSESSLLSCRHSGVGNHDCDHSQYASVQCAKTGGENKW